MIQRGYILVVLLMIIVNTLVGQSELTYDSYEYYTKGEYQKAAEIIDRAVVETSDSTNIESWQLRAAIYYEIFVKIDNKSILSDARVISLTSILKSIEYDTEKEFFKQSVNLLDRLSISYYNDAAYATTHLNIDDPKFAENSYQEYKRIQKIAYPDKNFDEKDKSFYKAEATSFAKKYQADIENNKDLFYLTIEALAKVLKIDSNDYGANFNTAIYYYNEGVYQIETIDSQTDMVQLIMIQKYGADMFKESLPYMLKADKIRRREETLRGLRGIYNVLYDDEKFEYYTRELEKFREENPDK